MDCLKIDGSHGGQILRAAALSYITGTPVRAEKIRRGRKVPDLGRLAAVRLPAITCGTATEGLKMGGERHVHARPYTQRGAEL